MKEPQGCIYHAVNKKNRKGYVGQYGGLQVERRWNGHIKDARGGSSFLFHRALRKNGYEKGFTWEVIWHGSISKLNKMETYYIKKLHTFVSDPLGGGYNLTMGGGGMRGYKYRPASRRKLSQAASRRWEDDTYREEMTRQNQLLGADLDIRCNRSSYKQNFWDSRTPKERKTIGKAIHRGHARRTPEERAALSVILSANTTKQWQAPGFRETRSASLAATLAARTPAERKANSVMHRKLSKKMWAERTPEERTAVSTAIMVGHAKRTPAEQEAYCESHRVGAINRYASMSSEERKIYWRKTHPNGNHPKEKNV